MSDQDSPGLVPDEPVGHGIDGSRVDESLQQAFAPAPMRFGRHADGLPIAEIRGKLPLAPPLSLDTMVCLGDTSRFVLRRTGWGDELARFDPEDVQRSQGGHYFVDVLTAIGAGVPWLEVLRHTDLKTGRVRVSPLRPQCSFLRQQMVDMQDAADAQMVERLCTARRDDERFFLSLRDTQVHACELRDPPDPESANRIALFNETKIELGRQRVEESGEMFDVDAALERARTQAKDGVTYSSIFDDAPRG